MKKSIIIIIIVLGLSGLVDGCNYYCHTCDGCETNITAASAGETVCLEANITDYAGTCIDNPSGFNDKTFDCQGYLIDGDDTILASDRGVSMSGKAGNTIQNCVMNQFYSSIYAIDSVNLTIKDNNITIPWTAITEGIIFYSCNDSNITNNTVQKNETGMGGIPQTNPIAVFWNSSNIYIAHNNVASGYHCIETVAHLPVYYQENITIHNNTISMCEYPLLLDESTSFSNITLNTVLDSQSCIYNDLDSNHNHIMHNVIDNCTAVGIKLNDADHNVIENNTIINTNSAIILSNSGGTNGSWYNNFTDNNITNCTKGIYFETIGTPYPSNYNRFVDNIMYNVDSYGVETNDVYSLYNVFEGTNMTDGPAAITYHYFLDKSYGNNISGGTLTGLGTASMHLETTWFYDNFINVGFPNPFRIWFSTDTTLFSYTNNSIKMASWMNDSGSAYIWTTRTMNEWNNTLLNWTDSQAGSHGFYNISGLIANSYYNISREGVYIQTLQTDADGVLSHFNLTLGTSIDIVVQFNNTVAGVDCSCTTCDECELALNNPSCSVVNLTADIIGFSGTCIDNPDNFTNKTFDCQGHIMESDGISVGCSPWYTAIYTLDKPNNTIQNCIIKNTTYLALKINGNSNYTRLINNTLEELGHCVYNPGVCECDHGYAIQFVQGACETNRSYYIEIINNTLKDIGAIGIGTACLSNSTISNNRVFTSGIYQEGRAIETGYTHNSTIAHNIINDTRSGTGLSKGLEISFTSSYNLYLNNTFTDPDGGSEIGIYSYFVSGNIQKHNTLINNTVLFYSQGITADYRAESMNITSNIFCSSSLRDMYLPNTNSTGDDNTCDSSLNWNDAGTTGCTYACALRVNFTDPTPVNGTSQSQTWAEINVSINESLYSLDTVKFNWNTTNYTFYDDSLVWGMNFDNVSALGEDYNDTNDSFVYDFSGSSNHGTTKNNLVWNARGGKYGGAFEFDGSNDYIDCGNDVSFDITDEITIEAWIKPNGGYSIGDGNGWVVGKDKMYRMGMYGASGKSFLYINSGAGGVFSVKDTWNDEWYHIVGTYNKDAGSNQLNMYINGILNNSATYSTAISTDVSAVRVGTHLTSEYFNGSIDEVRIYNRSLSADEVLMHYYSNLQKYDTARWLFYSNVSNLIDGNYTYYGWANDTDSGEDSTETRTLTIGGVACGQTIITNTILIANLNCSQDGLIFGANNIYLNCNGYNITGSGAYTGLTIDGYNNTEIKNCTMPSNFATPIYINNSNNTLLNFSETTGEISWTQCNNNGYITKPHLQKSYWRCIWKVTGLHTTTLDPSTCLFTVADYSDTCKNAYTEAAPWAPTWLKLTSYGYVTAAVLYAIYMRRRIRRYIKGRFGI